MPYTIKHTYLDKPAPISVNTIGSEATVNCSSRYELRITHPGRVTFSASATYRRKYFPQPIEGEHHPPTHPHTDTISLPLTVSLEKPDGTPFTGNEITRADLDRYRDQRGVTQGKWTFKIHGSAGPFFVTPEGETPVEFAVTAGVGRVQFEVEEFIGSKSPPPLVKMGFFPIGQPVFHTFDLYRIGTLIATTDAGPMTLRDPFGTVVATGNKTLTLPVTLDTLAKSRDVNGNVKLWRIFVDTPPANPSAPALNVFVTVLETARLRTSVLMDRIRDLIGEHGEKLKIYGENLTFPESGANGGQQLALRLVIEDEIAAGTIDMHGLLDDVIKRNPQNSPEIDKGDLEIKPGVPYTIASQSANENFSLPGPIANSFTAHSSFEGVKVTGIDVRFGQSTFIQPSVPALLLTVNVEGHIRIALEGQTIATAKVRNGRINVEAGVRLNEGQFVPAVWIDREPLDIDIAPTAFAGGPAFAAAVHFYLEDRESKLNREIRRNINEMLQRVMGKLPQTVAMLLGDDFTYSSLRLEGEDLVFDYIAPEEPNPRPAPASVYQYVPIMGRSATQQGPHAWSFGEELGDTWKADKLRQSIDHIVVVMMENRSYDHVLGYRARGGGDGSNGLTDELVAFLEAQTYSSGQKYHIKQLRASGIIPNALGFKTQLDAHVGHSLKDVTEQLSEKLETESWGQINNPDGFVRNFHPRLLNALNHSPELKVEDVLGYYDQKDLPFFKYLADNYAFCDRYFCSHAGPTLPNRMFWLTGGPQYDRNGEAIIDNNHGDNFCLSRATTIFDLLQRKRSPVKWRVYESPPSVAMLRMFARYVTDNVHIVPFSRLKEDVAKHPNVGFPSVVFIEPAMHHFPENDDHPPSDMYYGQMFLKEIYDTFRSNHTLFKRTLLIITYDEHGGFYDHVVPPMAEARIWPTSATGGGGGGPFTPMTLMTPYGVRVPTFVIGSTVKPGKGPSMVLDHCSILKTIIARFFDANERPFLSERVAQSRSFEDFIQHLWAHNPFDPPPLTPLTPSTSPAPGITTRPITRKEMRSGNADYHELTGMLARMLGRDKPH